MKVAQPGSVLTSTNHFYNLVLNLEKKKKIWLSKSTCMPQFTVFKINLANLFQVFFYEVEEHFELNEERKM